MSLATLVSSLALCLFSQTSQQTPQMSPSQVYSLPTPKGVVYWVDQANVWDAKDCILFFNADSTDDAVYMLITDTELGIFVDYGNNRSVDKFWFTNLKKDVDGMYDKNSKNKAQLKTFAEADSIYKKFRNSFDPYLQKLKKK